MKNYTIIAYLSYFCFASVLVNAADDPFPIPTGEINTQSRKSPQIIEALSDQKKILRRNIESVNFSEKEGQSTQHYIVIGCAQAGKSTLLNALMKLPLTLSGTGEPLKIEVDSYAKVGFISNNVRAGHTLHITCQEMRDRKSFFWDCPGLMESHTSYRITNNIILNSFFHGNKSVAVLGVIDYKDFEDTNDLFTPGNPAYETLSTIEQLFRHTNYSNVAIFVTKVPHDLMVDGDETRDITTRRKSTIRKKFVAGTNVSPSIRSLIEKIKDEDETKNIKLFLTDQASVTSSGEVCTVVNVEDILSKIIELPCQLDQLNVNGCIFSRVKEDLKNEIFKIKEVKEEKQVEEVKLKFKAVKDKLDILKSSLNVCSATASLSTSLSLTEAKNAVFSYLYMTKEEIHSRKKQIETDKICDVLEVSSFTQKIFNQVYGFGAYDKLVELMDRTSALIDLYNFWYQCFSPEERKSESKVKEAFISQLGEIYTVLDEKIQAIAPSWCTIS